LPERPCHRRLVRILSAALFGLLLAACAATVPPPVAPPADLRWADLPELPGEIRASVDEGTVITVNADDGVEIPVRLFGSDGRKTPVLMAHGLQSHSGWFAQSAAFIAGLGHPVYAVDRRGSGLSRQPRGDSKSFTEWSDDLHAVAREAMKRHGAGRLLVLGHCFGAIPATLYAESHPEVATGLILTTPGIFTRTSIPLSQMLTIATSRSGHRDYYFPVPLTPGEFSELPRYAPFIAADPLALRAATGDLYWQVHQARKHLLAHSDELTMPILVGFAEADGIADNAASRRWLAGLPAEARTEIVYPGARHILEYSAQRDRYFNDLRHWLAWMEEREP